MQKISSIIFILISLVSFAAVAQGGVVSSDSVEVKDLGEVSLDEVGLLSAKDDGFSSNMWQGSDALFVSLLLDKLPLQTKSPVIVDIKKRLLLSVAAKPANLQGTDTMFFARVKHLAGIGDSSSIANILRKVPENFRNERTDSIYTISLFSNQNYADGCKLAQASMQKYNNMFWRKIILACQASAGKNNELDLGMKLLKEDGKKLDANFIKIIDGLKGNDAEKISAKKDFINNLNLEIFPEKQVQQSFPRIMNHVQTMPEEYLNSWIVWMNSTGDSAKRIESMERFYAFLESLGETITIKQWQEMAIYSLANNIKIPSFVWTSLLQDAVNGKRQGEIAMIMIHAVGEDDLGALSPELLRWLIYAADEMKFKKDAQKIVVEAMGIK